ncbi:hypothetical protein MXAZACID_12335 [Acidocella sp. MX-AZ02]|nr:hypothetical protein MXAZACID_12335 [Acidocella sp. MX-AZ02]
MTEVQRDKLAGFRAALRGARPKAREAGGPLHRLALRVGVQRPGGFAPVRRPAGRGRRPNRRREMEFASLAVRASAPVGWPRALGMAGMVRSGRRQPVAAQRRGSALPGWLRRGVGGGGGPILAGAALCDLAPGWCPASYVQAPRWAGL